MTFREFMRERERLRVTNNLLGRFLNSGQIWVDGYSGHFQQGFQGVERGLQVLDGTDIGT